MADNHHVASGTHIARQAHLAIKHGLDGIALDRGYLELGGIVGKAGLAYGQGETILAGLEGREVYAERLATAEEAGGLNTYLLGFGSGKLVAYRGIGRQHRYQRDPYQGFLDIFYHHGFHSVRVN